MSLRDWVLSAAEQAGLKKVRGWDRTVEEHRAAIARRDRWAAVIGVAAGLAGVGYGVAVDRITQDKLQDQPVLPVVTNIATGEVFVGQVVRGAALNTSESSRIAEVKTYVRLMESFDAETYAANYELAMAVTTEDAIPKVEWRFNVNDARSHWQQLGRDGSARVLRWRSILWRGVGDLKDTAVVTFERETTAGKRTQTKVCTAELTVAHPRRKLSPDVLEHFPTGQHAAFYNSWCEEGGRP